MSGAMAAINERQYHARARVDGKIDSRTESVRESSRPCACGWQGVTFRVGT